MGLAVTIGNGAKFGADKSKTKIAENEEGNRLPRTWSE
jgi:hypothetical protein